MAKFADVMKQAKRMCRQIADCEECPIGANLDCVCVIGDLIEMMDAKKIESIVMDWAAANPEPRCPTWEEAWKMLYPNVAESHPPCPRYFMDDERAMEYCNARCEECHHKPIPADIAEKLGIKPIGGNDGKM